MRAPLTADWANLSLSVATARPAEIGPGATIVQRSAMVPVRAAGAIA